MGCLIRKNTFQYEYNPLNQLTRVLKNGEGLREYSYDAFGNRILKKEGIIETNYIYNENNQLIRETGQEIKDYQYDLRGNLRTVSVNGAVSRSYEFDARNHMEAVYGENGILSTYQYNGLGHRIGKRAHNQNVPTELEYVLDFTRRGNNLLERIENGEVEDYFWDKNIVSSIGESHKKQFLNDELGSTIRTCFSNGKEAGLYDYDEFGEVTSKKEILKQPFGFTGYQWDENSNTFYAQAREYCPSSGSFISEDLVNDIVGLPETLNHYGYCWGNPCKWVDVNGQFTQRDANQLIANYYIDEYERSFNAWKDDVSNAIDYIGKSVNNGMDSAKGFVNDNADGIQNGISDATTAVNEWWKNDIFGVDKIIYSKEDFSAKSHTGGGILVAVFNNKQLTNAYVHLSVNIPFTNETIGYKVNCDYMNNWLPSNLLYYSIKDLDANISNTIGVGYNKEGLYINNCTSGGTNNIPILLPNDVSLESYTNVSWVLSHDETFAHWDELLAGACVVTAATVAVVCLSPEIIIGGLIQGGAVLVSVCGKLLSVTCGG